MSRLAAYHRPSTLEEAVALLHTAGRVVLAGGTTIRHVAGDDPVELVDLQALDLRTVSDSGAGGGWTLGAMVRLDELAESIELPELVRWAARIELPSTLRSLATVGGTVGAADPESVLLAALLAHDAIVRMADGASRSLVDVLATGLGAADLIVAVEIEGRGRSAHAVTGRTPADTPIVAAVGRAAPDGTVRLALTGVAPTPTFVDLDSVALRRFREFDPPGDFRGSADYRRHLATVLAARVIEELT